MKTLNHKFKNLAKKYFCVYASLFYNKSVIMQVLVKFGVILLTLIDAEIADHCPPVWRSGVEL